MGKPPARNSVVGGDLPQVVEIRLEPGEARCRRAPSAELRTASSRVSASHDDLGEHRVVERRHLRAALHPRLAAHAGGKRHVGEHARARAEVRAPGPRHRRAPESNAPRVLAQRSVSSGGSSPRRQAHHPLDDVDACHFFGDAVLDLQARVHLEEVEVARGRRRRGTRPCRPTGSAPLAPASTAAANRRARDVRRSARAPASPR